MHSTAGTYTLNVGLVVSRIRWGGIRLPIASHVQGQLAHRSVNRYFGWRIGLFGLRSSRFIHYLVSTRDMLWELRTDCSQKLRQCGRVPRVTCSRAILPCNVKSSERLM